MTERKNKITRKAKERDLSNNNRQITLLKIKKERKIAVKGLKSKGEN